MITNLIISVICLLISILLFLKYNSGLGAPLGSFRKRFLYLLSPLAFIAFIVFLNRAYYFSDNQNQKRIAKELKKEFYELERMMGAQIDNFDLDYQDKQSEIRFLLKQIDYDTNEKNDSLQISKLTKEYFEHKDKVDMRKDSIDLLIQKKHSEIGKLVQQLDSEVHKECDIYVNIITNILSAFIAFVIAFTFKNRILG